MDYNSVRRKTREVRVGKTVIGGKSPVSIQSMTNTDTKDSGATAAQIRRLTDAGCDIVRVAVPDREAARAVYDIKCMVPDVPIVADIHFDAALAVMCAEAGADKIRINPGNIGDEGKVKSVVDACRRRRIPIRVGVNSGSLEKKLLNRYGAPTAEALASSALDNVAMLERFDFNDIVVAIKSSDVVTMTKAVRIAAERCDYPIHIGVTEAGSERAGIIKSSAGSGSLLLDGIGDTIRVSLTADPVKEVITARTLLSCLGISEREPVDLVSCPTCGRTRVDLISLVNEFESRMSELHPPRRIKVAIMGCAVNGPGEASDADIGVACGTGEGLFFSHGKVLYKVPEDKIIQQLIDGINSFGD